MHHVQEPACIYKAIDMLKRDPFSSTRAILLDYIDWKRELPRRAPRIAVMGPTGGDYPAADALGMYGTGTVILEVKAIMRSEEKNATTRTNAAKVYFALKPFPPTIAFIVHAAGNAGDRQAGDEMEKFAAGLPRYCYKAEDECQEAFNDATNYLTK